MKWATGEGYTTNGQFIFHAKPPRYTIEYLPWVRPIERTSPEEIDIYTNPPLKCQH